MAKGEFEVEKLSLDGLITFGAGNADPKVTVLGPISEYPVGSVYIRNNGELWLRYNNGDHQWRQIGSLNVQYLSFPGQLYKFEGLLRWYPPLDISLWDIHASLGVPCEKKPTKFDLLKNGVSILSSPGTFPVNSNLSNPVGISNGIVLVTDYLTFDITDCDNKNSGEYLSIRIRYRFS